MNRTRYFQLMEDLDGNTSIRQYLKLDYLLQLLESRTYYVKRKRYFEDKRESTLPLKSLFRLRPVGDTANSSVDDDSVRNSLGKYSFYKTSGDYLTSCWTERVGESALMWKNFVENKGACIKTTINNFVASFRDDNYDILCGRISYNGYNAEQTIMETLFSKDRAFSEEKEIRFYFAPRDRNVDISDNHASIGVDPNVLIDEIILSPYIEPLERKGLEHELNSNYKIKVSSSKIELNK